MMRAVGRAAWNAALAALWGAVVFFGVRTLADFAHRTHRQEGIPLLVLFVLMAVYLTWLVRRDDPAAWMACLGVIATVMLFVHVALLDARALRAHGLEQHARITEVRTRFSSDDTEYQVYTLQALDGPPIDGTVTGALGRSRRVGEVVTVTTDPSGRVAPKLGGLPSATAQAWMGRLDTALAVLLVAVLVGWATARTRERPAPQRDPDHGPAV